MLRVVSDRTSVHLFALANRRNISVIKLCEKQSNMTSALLAFRDLNGSIRHGGYNHDYFADEQRCVFNSDSRRTAQEH